jgi:hypothetical protein
VTLEWAEPPLILRLVRKWKGERVHLNVTGPRYIGPFCQHGLNIDWYAYNNNLSVTVTLDNLGLRDFRHVEMDFICMICRRKLAQLLRCCSKAK